MQQELYSPCEFVHTQTRNQTSNLNFYPKPWTNPHSYFWGSPTPPNFQPNNWWDDSLYDEKKPSPSHSKLYTGEALYADPMAHSQVCSTPNDLISCNTCLKFRQESSSIFKSTSELLAVLGAIVIFIVLFIVFV